MSKLAATATGNLLKTQKNIKHKLIWIAYGERGSYVFVFELDK